MMSQHKKSRIIGQEMRKIHLSNKQLQLCYGMMMGDSSISQRKNGQCRIKISHSEKQLQYLEWKKSLLKEFIPQIIPTVNTPSKLSFNTNPDYIYTSIVHQDFTDLYGIFYQKNLRNGKIVSMKILNKLTEFSIFIWFLDDGCYSYNPQKGHKIYLSTYRYTIGEHQMMKKWFWHTWRIESIITYDKTHDKYYLRFNKKDIILFNNLFIKPFLQEIPECMLYKVPKL